MSSQKPEVRRENFNLKSFFQTNYGLGRIPTVTPLDKKKVVIGAIVAVLGLILGIAVSVVLLIATVVGGIIIALPIVKNKQEVAYKSAWNAEWSRRNNTWPAEFDKFREKTIKDQNLKDRGMNYLGVDAENLIKDEKGESSAFSIRGNNFDGAWRRTNGVYRTEYVDITWLYLGVDQLYIYKVRLSLSDPSAKREDSMEFFYKDIVSVSVAQEGVDVKGSGADESESVKQVDVERFRLTVPGDKISFAYTPTDYTTGRINSMKQMIREKKNS